MLSRGQVIAVNVENEEVESIVLEPGLQMSLHHPVRIFSWSRKDHDLFAIILLLVLFLLNMPVAFAMRSASYFLFASGLPINKVHSLPMSAQNGVLHHCMHHLFGEMALAEDGHNHKFELSTLIGCPRRAAMQGSLSQR